MTERKFPRDPGALTPELLTAVLAAERPGVAVRRFDVVEVARSMSGRASTADRVVLDLDFAPGAPTGDLPRRMILKTALANPIAPPVMYETELRFYREIRPHVPFEAPAFYGGHFDAPSGQFGILLEDLGQRGAVFANVTMAVSLDQVRSLLRSLAALHAQYWQSPRLAGELGWLATPARGGMTDFFRAIWPQIDTLLRREPWRFEVLAPIGREPEALHRDMLAVQAGPLESGPRTLLHGDTHLGNTYLIGEEQTGLLDFQLAMQGCFSRDLTYILSTALSIEQRRKHERELIAYYLEELRRRGVVDAPAFDEAWRLHRQSAIWGLVIGWLTCPEANYGRAITEENLRRLVAAVVDLESVKAVPH